MSNLLLDDNPLMVLPKLAEKIGLNESIILQQVHYWLKKKLHAKEGYYWTYNSYPEWQKQFPFWSESTIKRTITKLESMNLLIAGNYNKMKVDKTKWYRLNYEELDKYNEKEVFNGREACYDASGQNDPTNVSYCTDEDTNMNRPLPKTSSKTNTKTIKPSSPKYKISDMDNAKLLFELMKNHNPDAKEPNFETWANDMRKIRELDNRTDEQIKYLINWCQNDDFWFVNILSPSKLRTKWDQLVLKVKQSNNKTMQNKQKSSILEELANGYSTNSTNTINGQNSLPQQIESRREGISWNLL